MKRFKIGDRVVVLHNFNNTATDKIGIILANRDGGHTVGFFREGIMTNYELEAFVDKHPGLKATWWFYPRELELANNYTKTKFK